MPYYNTCSRCGANLDPGEKCDCQRESTEQYIRASQVRSEKELFYAKDTNIYKKYAP